MPRLGQAVLVLQRAASLCKVTLGSRTAVQLTDSRVRLQARASASGLLTLNHTSRGWEGLLCAPEAHADAPAEGSVRLEPGWEEAGLFTLRYLSR